MNENNKICPACGTSVKYNETTCSVCGAKFTKKESGLLVWLNESEKGKALVSKIKKFVLIFIITFVIFNIFIFGAVLQRASKENMNREARMYLSSALAINKVYIFPLSNTFGFKSIITKPFYLARNLLYKIGMSKLDKNDGERLWWWWRIKEQEFVILYEKEMFSWNDWNVPSKEIADELIRMEDEVYHNLINIPNVKPYDKSLTKEKYLMFIDTGYRYAEYFSALPHQYNRNFDVDYSNLQIQHFENVYNVYLKYKNYAEKNEKESIKYFQQNEKLSMREPELVCFLLYQILLVDYQKGNLKCDNQYFKPFAQKQTYILDYILANYKKLNTVDYNGLTLHILPIGGYEEMKEICSGSKTFEVYKKYVDKRDKYPRL